MGLLTSRATVAEVRLLRLAPLLLERFGALMNGFRDQDQALYARALRGGTLFTLFTTISIYGLFLHVVYRSIEGALTLGDVAIFGVATLHYCESTGAPHHAEWAREYEMPEPSWWMWFGGALSAVAGALGIGFVAGARRTG